MQKKKQIHTTVPKQFWTDLVKNTDMWPPAQRVIHQIGAYALHELHVESLDDSPPDASAPWPTPWNGDMVRVQVYTYDPAVAATWERLSQMYGSGSAALRVALARLYTCSRQ